jgi:hypothetical protein
MFKPRKPFQSSLRDLFWLVVVAAVFTSWGIDRLRLAQRIDSLENPVVLPSPYYQPDDIQYFPAGPEFILSNDSAAQKAYKAEEEARMR